MDQYSDCTADQRWRIPTVTFLLWSLAAFFYSLRLMGRPRMESHYARRFFADDKLLIIPLICSLGVAVSTLPLTAKGLGKHYKCADADTTIWFFKSLFAWEILYCIILTTTKMSILLMFRRLFVERFEKFFWILTMLVMAWGVATILAAVLICQPVSRMWNDPKRCGDIPAFYWGVAIPNILTDVAILCSALWLIRPLKLRVVQKVGLVIAFSCGLFVTIVSCIRFAVLLRTPLGPDFIWDVNDEVVWSQTEQNAAIISACLPTLRPFLMQIYRLAERYLVRLPTVARGLIGHSATSRLGSVSAVDTVGDKQAWPETAASYETTCEASNKA